MGSSCVRACVLAIAAIPFPPHFIARSWITVVGEHFVFLLQFAWFADSECVPSFQVLPVRRSLPVNDPPHIAVDLSFGSDQETNTWDTNAHSGRIHYWNSIRALVHTVRAYTGPPPSPPLLSPPSQYNTPHTRARAQRAWTNDRANPTVLTAFTTWGLRRGTVERTSFLSLAQRSATTVGCEVLRPRHRYKPARLVARTLLRALVLA